MSALNEKNFAREVQLAIDNAIKDKEYSNYYVVAKSIGTKALSFLLDNTMLKDAKVVWLTPLLQSDDVFNAMVNSDNKGLCIFGEKDTFCFIVERFEKLKVNQNLVLKVVDSALLFFLLNNIKYISFSYSSNLVQVVKGQLPLLATGLKSG